ncbi:MAG: hypothetical protein IPM29_04505 [Planctomycetes bacterium]|nr:hypothetical protein [Planctomycetota bacterium]
MTNLRPAVTCCGTELRCSSVRVVEPAGEDPRITVRLPRRGLAQPALLDSSLTVTIEDTVVRGVVTEIDDATSESTETLTITAPMGVAAAQGPMTFCATDQRRSALLRRSLPGIELTETRRSRCDETHREFVVLLESGWRLGRFLALLGGQLLLAVGERAVVARPDEPADVERIEPRTSTARRAAAPTLVLTAMPHGHGSVPLRHVRSGAAMRPARSIHLVHTASLSELRAAAEAIAAVERDGEFRADGGPELLEIGPGDWVDFGAGPRLVTGRERCWNEHAGWQVVLHGGYPWEDVVGGRPPIAEPVRVAGFDGETGRVEVALTRHDGLAVGAALDSPRAGARQLVAVLPGVGDLGRIGFDGAFERAVYLGAAVPDCAMKKEWLERDIVVIADDSARLELSREGDLEHRLGRVTTHCDVLEQNTGTATWTARRISIERAH